QSTAAEAAGHAVVPGQRVSVTAYIRMSGSGDDLGARVLLAWYKSNGDFISLSVPAASVHRTGGAWRPSSHPASAPGQAAFVRAGVSATNTSGGNPPIDVDAFTWTYTPPVAANLQYRAVQPEAGFSASTEPVWPGVLGEQVIDNEV